MVKRENLGETWRQFQLCRDRPRRDRLIEAYLPLVQHAAGRLKDKLPSSIDILDLVSAGRIGLIKAVENFQAAYGVKFETYCNQRVRGAILDDLREGDWVPRLIRARANCLRRTRSALAFELGREPSEGEIASRMGVSMKRYYALLEEIRVHHQVSIEGDLAGELGVGGKGDNPAGEELLPDPRQEPPLDRLEREEIREIALKGLSSKERAIISLHYFEGRNMKEIGKELGISSSRVCQIHTRVMRLLRERFLSEPYLDWRPGGGRPPWRIQNGVSLSIGDRTPRAVESRRASA
jgi:RNA polymerase sigma factor for flagellar operon FliA